MPTGYTCNIKKGISFRDFTMCCARAFGALITMRDDPMDAEIPDEIMPSDWHKEELAKSESEYERLRTLSIDEAGKEAQKEFQEESEKNKNKIIEYSNLRKKYNDMLAQVEKWQPPTQDHIELKQFMIDQIRGSINFDCDENYVETPKLLSGEEWLSQKISECMWNIKYHIKEYAEEVQRCKYRTEWVQVLKKSLEDIK